MFARCFHVNHSVLFPSPCSAQKQPGAEHPELGCKTAPNPAQQQVLGEPQSSESPKASPEMVWESSKTNRKKSTKKTEVGSPQTPKARPETVWETPKPAPKQVEKAPKPAQKWAGEPRHQTDFGQLEQKNFRSKLMSKTQGPKPYTINTRQK